MNRSLLAAALAPAALVIAAAPLAAQQPAPAAPLTADQQTLLHCSAMFSIVSGRQHAGDKAALAFPDVTARGREYFVRALVELMDEAHLDRDTIARMVKAEAAQLLDSPDPLAGMPACLASLEASKL
jgi:hypothetical protein